MTERFKVPGYTPPSKYKRSGKKKLTEAKKQSILSRIEANQAIKLREMFREDV